MGQDRIGSFNVLVRDGASPTLAMAQMEEVLRREHRLRIGQENDFWIQDRAELMGTQQETTQTFTYLLAGIALVSLLVGGIGIMNIMLVSVTERTREIGVRMAMGATRRAVLSQFLLEALVLCLVGGLLGIAVGFGASGALAELAGWNTAVSPQAVGLAVAFSATVGLFFGIWPARRAAALDPIEALRYE
jgi:putative ABC transport system permease protein